MLVKRKVCLAIACLLCADDGVRLVILRLQHSALAEREPCVRTVPDCDVKHRLIRAELHFVNIKLKSLGHVTIPRISPNLLSPSRHSDEGKEKRK